MAIDVSAQREIAAERGRVASYVSDPSNDPEWIGGIETARWLTEPPLQVGTRVERSASFLGRRITYVLEVAELRPESRLRMTSVKGPFPMVVTYEFDDASAGRTRALIRVEGEPSGFYGRFAAPIMAPAVRRNLRRDLRRLAARLEG